MLFKAIFAAFIAANAIIVHGIFDDVECDSIQITGLDEIFPASESANEYFNQIDGSYSSDRRIWSNGQISVYFSDRFNPMGEWIISNPLSSTCLQIDLNSTHYQNNSVPVPSPPLSAHDSLWDCFDSDHPYGPVYAPYEFTLQCFVTKRPTSAPSPLPDPATTESDDSGDGNASQIAGISADNDLWRFLIFLILLCVLCLFADGVRRLLLKMRDKKKEVEDEQWMTAGMTEEQKEAAMAGIASTAAVRRATHSAAPPSPRGGHNKVYTYSQAGDEPMRVGSTSSMGFKLSVEMAQGGSGSAEVASDKPPPSLSLPGTVVTISPPKGLQTPVETGKEKGKGKGKDKEDGSGGAVSPLLSSSDEGPTGESGSGAAAAGNGGSGRSDDSFEKVHVTPSAKEIDTILSQETEEDDMEDDESDSFETDL